MGKPHNGHRCRNAWNVSLWLNNEEGTYRLMRECIRYTRNRREAAERMMGYLPEKTPDGVPYTKTSVREAMIGL